MIGIHWLQAGNMAATWNCFDHPSTSQELKAIGSK
jgi:hypothetical protein